MTKKILIHVGPHKTGSTSIQRALADAGSYLHVADTVFLHNKLTHDAAMALANEEYERAELLLSNVASQVSRMDENRIILSQEDFCGDLPGRTGRRAIYPKLTKNLRILRRAFRHHDVNFLFFARLESDWLRSCYHQHLKYRTRFSSFESFRDHYGHELNWDDKLEKPRETFGRDILVQPYERLPAAGVRGLLSHIAPDADIHAITQLVTSANPSPTPQQIRALEHINAQSEFKQSAGFAKTLVLNNWAPARPVADQTAPAWPPKARARAVAKELASLQRRVEIRVGQQTLPDIMPPVDVDLNLLAFDYLPSDAELPQVPRANISDQSRILDYHLRGKSRLSHLNALVISYLRRNSNHTAKARQLFQRIWAETGVLLVNELPTRWLISSLQTFLDHGINEAQRSIGTAGYFFSNMMKIYEGERAIEGAEQDSIYAEDLPQTPNRFRGLDRFDLGGTDLLLNTNALLLEIAQRDDVAGLVLQELLVRIKHSGNVFTRYDNSRKKHNISVPGFEDTWSFFDPL